MKNVLVNHLFTHFLAKNSYCALYRKRPLARWNRNRKPKVRSFRPLSNLHPGRWQQTGNNPRCLLLPPAASRKGSQTSVFFFCWWKGPDESDFLARCVRCGASDRTSISTLQLAAGRRCGSLQFELIRSRTVVLSSARLPEGGLTRAPIRQQLHRNAPLCVGKGVHAHHLPQVFLILWFPWRMVRHHHEQPHSLVVPGNPGHKIDPVPRHVLRGVVVLEIFVLRIRWPDPHRLADSYSAASPSFTCIRALHVTS